jgi:hypothetical protein
MGRTPSIVAKTPKRVRKKSQTTTINFIKSALKGKAHKKRKKTRNQNENNPILTV